MQPTPRNSEYCAEDRKEEEGSGVSDQEDDDLGLQDLTSLT